jgi:hypothetical protein
MCVVLLETLQMSVVDTVSLVADRWGMYFGCCMLTSAVQNDVCNNHLAGQDSETMRRSMFLDCFELMSHSAADRMRFVVVDSEERPGIGEWIN